jgi:nitroreductase
MELNEVLEKRASVRKYSDKKIKIEEIIDLIFAANLAPSPGNLAILHYIITEDPKKIKIIADACQQSFIADSPFLVVFCSNPAKSEIMYEEQSPKYVKHHVGAAIENFLLAVTNKGYASCWIGAFSELIIKETLNIPDSIEVEAICPVAYEHKTSKTKQRTKPKLDYRIYFEKWNNKTHKPPVLISNI